jgi:hypothetical protein
MKTFFRSIYARLPIIRELHRIANDLQVQKYALEGIAGEVRASKGFRHLAECAALVQALETIKAGDARYRDPKRLLAHGAQYWSQNYEDGMIAEIFRRVKPTTRTFVEIGVENGSETNTTCLLAQGWRGWWFEGNPRSCESIRNRLKTMPALASRLSLREAFISPANINALFEEMSVPREVDLFSLDIDLDTYHIWAALREFRPRVVVVEYNAGLPPDQNWVHPYTPNQMWDYTQAFGASLKACELLGKEYGYSLVGCDITGINAFFVRNDLVEDHFVPPFTAENHYEPRRYHLYHRWGHPSCLYGETHGEKIS